MWITCDVFISFLDSHSDGTPSLQRIYWWAKDVILNFPKSVLMKKQTHLYLRRRTGGYKFPYNLLTPYTRLACHVQGSITEHHIFVEWISVFEQIGWQILWFYEFVTNSLSLFCAFLVQVRLYKLIQNRQLVILMNTHKNYEPVWTQTWTNGVIQAIQSLLEHQVGQLNLKT